MKLPRHDAVAAGQPHGRTDADEARMGRRPTDRIAGVGPQACGPEAAGDRCGRPPARTGGNAVERIGIARMAGQQRTNRLEWACGELRHVRLGEHDCPRLAQLADLIGVVQRHRILQTEGTRRRGETCNVVIVLDDHRYAVQRTMAKRASSMSALASAPGLRTMIALSEGPFLSYASMRS